MPAGTYILRADIVSFCMMIEINLFFVQATHKFYLTCTTNAVCLLSCKMQFLLFFVFCEPNQKKLHFDI